MNSRVGLAAAALIGLALAAGARSYTASDPPARAIRVDQAARAVCGESLATLHADLEARARACRADVAEQVRAKIEARTADATRRNSIQLASIR